MSWQYHGTMKDTPDYEDDDYDLEDEIASEEEAAEEKRDERELEKHFGD